MSACHAWTMILNFFVFYYQNQCKVTKSFISPSIPINALQLIYWNLLSAVRTSQKNKVRQQSFVQQLAVFQNSNVRISCYFSHSACFCYFLLPESPFEWKNKWAEPLLYSSGLWKTKQNKQKNPKWLHILLGWITSNAKNISVSV